MDLKLNSKEQSLCFNREDFTAADFSVDKFVSQYRKYASLDAIREDLNIMYKKLCTAMVELINQDYADFVNLSTNLVGLDKSIKNLTSPLENLKSEVEQIHKHLLTAVGAGSNTFSEGTSAYTSKVAMQHIIAVFEGLAKIEELRCNGKKKDNLELGQMETLERIAFVTNNVAFHISELSCTGQSSFAPTKAWNNCCMNIKKLSENLEKELEGVFLRCLKSPNTSDLEKVLRIFTLINGEREVEKCFRVKIVQPFMKQVITENKITKEGLANVYDDILSILPKYGAILNSARNTDEHAVVNIPGYDFLVNAVWPEIMFCFESISPVLVFSIGDPQKFHENYSATMNFLEKFEHHCFSQNSVVNLRRDVSYREFIGKWNLTVYFEIRFQEIASKLEEQIYRSSFSTSNRSSYFMLDATQCLYTCLECCWNESIFLPCLKSNFFKLFLQLLSRYKRYSDSHLKVEENSVFIAKFINDVEILVIDVQKLFNDAVLPKFSDNEKDCISAAFDESIAILENIPYLAAKLIVKQLSEKCSSHLKLIASLPQRYRKTNREVPSKPSPYVAQVFEPLSEFFLEAKFLSLKWKNYCQTEVVDDILQRCVVSMRDVLTSIKKMEDSLKILKRAKATSGQFPSGAISDDDKIRRQLALDVSCFEELILNFGMETSSLKTLKELKDLIKSAERVPNVL